jgi:hypothetical protein
LKCPNARSIVTIMALHERWWNGQLSRAARRDIWLTRHRKADESTAPNPPL